MRRRQARAPEWRVIRWGRRALAGLVLLALLAMIVPPLGAQTTSSSGIGALIPIRGTIDNITLESLERRIQDARDQGATTLIFEMDTPGGLVSSALEICRLIENQPEEIRTVAWVNPDAYSAGAMISVACNEIWMSPSSSIGDCAPIMISPGGPVEMGETERAKIESPILQKFRDAAIRNGYDLLLSRAMVTANVEVWWVEHPETGERRFVTGEEKDELLGRGDEEAGTMQPAASSWRLVETYVDARTGEPVPVEQPVDRENTLLTMSQSDAVAFGFAKGIVANVGELTEELQLSAIPMEMERSGWEIFAAWMNSPIVRGVLLAIVLMGAWAELQSPGLILPGTAALVALILFLVAPYASGLANIWTLLLIAAGVILLGVEVFVLPGFGVAGFLGVALVAVGMIATFVPATPPELPTFSLQQTWDGLLTGIKVMVGSVLVSMVGIMLLIRYLPESRLGRGIILADATGGSVTRVEDQPAVALPGDVGVVTGALRPGGQARFGQEIVDVHSQSGYVDAGRRVQVIKRDGMHIFVRPLPEEDAGATQS